VLEPQRGNRQNADAFGADEEWIFVRSVVGAAVLHYSQAARRHLVVDAVVEQDHGIRHVLLEPLPRQEALAALARNHGGHPLVLQPPEQPPQLGPEDAVIRQAREQGLDRVEDDPFRSYRPNRVVEPDKQPFEIVLAGLLDLAALDAIVVDRKLPRLNQLRQIEAQRCDVVGDFIAVLLEREEHAGSGAAADKRRSSFRQSAANISSRPRMPVGVLGRARTAGSSGRSGDWAGASTTEAGLRRATRIPGP
jgi:hypothetical protein